MIQPWCLASFQLTGLGLTLARVPPPTVIRPTSPTCHVLPGRSHSCRVAAGWLQRPGSAPCSARPSVPDTSCGSHSPPLWPSPVAPVCFELPWGPWIGCRIRWQHLRELAVTTEIARKPRPIESAFASRLPPGPPLASWPGPENAWLEAERRLVGEADCRVFKRQRCVLPRRPQPGNGRNCYSIGSPMAGLWQIYPEM